MASHSPVLHPASTASRTVKIGYLLGIGYYPLGQAPSYVRNPDGRIFLFKQDKGPSLNEGGALTKLSRGSLGDMNPRVSQMDVALCVWAPVHITVLWRTAHMPAQYEHFTEMALRLIDNRSYQTGVLTSYLLCGIEKAIEDTRLRRAIASALYLLRQGKYEIGEYG
jgi:hypothetical protein